MKKMFKYAMLFAAAYTLTWSMTSCSDDDKGDDGKTTIEKQEQAVKDLTAEYLNNVVYPTYGNLASEAEGLYAKINALKAKLKAGTRVEQSEIDAICTSYKAARQYWEESEAFLYGAASDFEIDPHIDSWPLDVPTLAKDLASDAKIKTLDKEAEDIEVTRKNLTAENLGFHGIEFIFFRDGKNRPASFFNNDEVEKYENIFDGKNVTAKEEVIFATAVAGDLRDKCYQLVVAWNPAASAAYKARIAECAKHFDDFKTLTKKGLTYGEDLLQAGTAKSTQSSVKKVVETILVSGCSNICAEVADQKMGQAYRASKDPNSQHEGEDGKMEPDDPNYIESPYSYNSFTDFYDNIMSIQNSLYGNYNGNTYAAKSLMSYLNTYNVVEAALINAKLTAALKALKACQTSGTPFVLNPGAPLVKAAMDAVGELDSELNKASQWILKN